MDFTVNTRSPDSLAAAVELREAIHVAATVRAVSQPCPRGAVAVINGFSARGGTVAVLAEDGRWRWFIGRP